jgi:hypothetical protein
MRGLFFLLAVCSGVALFCLWQDNMKEQGALQATIKANSLALSDMLEQQRTLSAALCTRDASYAAITEKREKAERSIQEALRHDKAMQTWADCIVPAVFDGVF